MEWATGVEDGILRINAGVEIECSGGGVQRRENNGER